MRTVDIISRKRNGETLSEKELEYFIKGYVDGSIPDYQVSALLMAVYFQGMTPRETATLTRLMMNSGDVFDLSQIPGVKVDKHSTGGVGDKVSIVLAPLVASAGVPVPMVSGRGLGHTGGTLDKLESIPGFDTNMNEKEFRSAIEEIGVAIIGQTDNFVPADKKLYALRDVTATVESIPLISASIVSKKAASGADAFVFDVKTGSGAFMQTKDRARDLAESLISVMKELGKRCSALITDMNQPLGNAVGNSLEIMECIDVLKGNGPKDLVEICIELGSRMLVMGGKCQNTREADEILRENLGSGKALEKFIRMVELQNGDAGIAERPEIMNLSEHYYDLKSTGSGYISSCNTREIGNASMILGAGRTEYSEPVDHGVGVVCKKKIGDKVENDDVIFILYYRDEESLTAAKKRLENAITISPEKPEVPELIKESLGEI